MDGSAPVQLLAMAASIVLLLPLNLIVSKSERVPMSGHRIFSTPTTLATRWGAPVRLLPRLLLLLERHDRPGHLDHHRDPVQVPGDPSHALAGRVYLDGRPAAAVEPHCRLFVRR